MIFWDSEQEKTKNIDDWQKQTFIILVNLPTKSKKLIQNQDLHKAYHFKFDLCRLFRRVNVIRVILAQIGYY